MTALKFCVCFPIKKTRELKIAELVFESAANFLKNKSHIFPKMGIFPIQSKPENSKKGKRINNLPRRFDMPLTAEKSAAVKL